MTLPHSLHPPLDSSVCRFLAQISRQWGIRVHAREVQSGAVFQSPAGKSNQLHWREKGRDGDARSVWMCTSVTSLTYEYIVCLRVSKEPLEIYASPYLHSIIYDNNLSLHFLSLTWLVPPSRLNKPHCSLQLAAARMKTNKWPWCFPVSGWQSGQWMDGCGCFINRYLLSEIISSLKQLKRAPNMNIF